jgi:hypothetical protein
MLNTFEGTTIERDEDGLLWIRDPHGNIACQAYFQSEGESQEEILDQGYILVPYRFEGKNIYVEVASEG